MVRLAYYIPTSLDMTRAVMIERSLVDILTGKHPIIVGAGDSTSAFIIPVRSIYRANYFAYIPAIG